MSRFSIKKQIYVDAAPERVFSNLTSASDMIRYFPLTKVTSDWTVGGEIILEGEVIGRPFRDHGIILALSPPKEFSYSYWSDNHGAERVTENYLTIEYHLAPHKQGTELVMRHTNIKSSNMFEVMDSVWDYLLDSFAKYTEKRD